MLGFRYSLRAFSCSPWEGRSQSRDKSHEDGSQPALNGDTVGGRGSFKGRPGDIVLPDPQRRKEFAGGCQKVSGAGERRGPLFTGL